MINHLLDWLYPPRCIACRELLPLSAEERFICVACKDLFEPISWHVCARCGIPLEGDSEDVKYCHNCRNTSFHFASNRAAFLYDDLLRDLLFDIKYHRKRRVSEGLGELWASVTSPLPGCSNVFLVPVPMHKAKKRERGYNQAEDLARALSRGIGLPVANVLTRNRDTPPQSGLSPHMRAENLQSAFYASPETEGKKYILVDDIYTTGATLNECAKTLISAGAASVSCMTLTITAKNINGKPK